MAYRTGKVSTALWGIVASIPRPSYMRRIAKTTLDYRFQQATRRIPSVSLESLTNGVAEVRVRLANQEWGATPTNDLLALGALVAIRRPSTVFEFGTFTGNATLHLAMNAAPGAKVFTLDIPPGDRRSMDGLNWETSIDDSIVGQCYRRSEFAPQIQQILADSRQFDPAPYKGKMDFVWVDACHEYEFVRNDSTKAFEMLAPGGVVAWHDYSRACPGVARYLSEISRDREVCRVEGTQVAFTRSGGQT